MTSKERRARKEARQERDRNNGGGGLYVLGKHGFEFEFFKHEVGDLNLHILPYIIQSENHPEVVAGRSEIGDEDYFLEFGQHYNVAGIEGAVLCLKSTFNKPCPVCEEIAEQQLEAWPSRRVIYNVMDEDDKIQIFTVSRKNFHQELKDKLNRWKDGWFDYSDLEHGKMVYCYASKTQGAGMTWYTYKDFSFVDREPLDESLLDRTIPLGSLLNVPTYQQLRDLMDGKIKTINFTKDDDEEEPRQSSKKSKVEEEKPRRSSKKSKVVEEPEEEPDEEEELEYGDECPQGLKFGEDFESSKKKCGTICSNSDFKACKIAHEE